MIHQTVGQLGHFFVILSFVTALVATIGYLASALARQQVAQAEPVNELELAYAGEATGRRWLAGLSIFTVQPLLGWPLAFSTSFSIIISSTITPGATRRVRCLCGI